MSFLQRPKRHDQKDMRFFKDIATLLVAQAADGCQRMNAEIKNHRMMSLLRFAEEITAVCDCDKVT
jgi:hypothetical protein